MTVIIEVSNAAGTPPDYHNTVHISGLAIYGHDALKYTYTVTEDDKPGYTATRKTDSSKLENLVEMPLHLENKLDVFNLKLYKSFGREYQDSEGQEYIEPIPANDMEQFFNSAYFEQLTFSLYRTTDPDTTPATAYKTVTGRDIGFERGAGVNFNTAKNAYYCEFKALPLTDENGVPYFYWVQETDGAQSTSSDKVFTVYANAYEGSVKEATLKPVALANAPEKIKVEKSDSGQKKEEYIQNVFMAKKIAINKYWLDDNNADGLRPEELNVVVHEIISGQDPVNIARTLYNVQQGTNTNTGGSRNYSDDVTTQDISSDNFTELRLTNERTRTNGSVSLNKTFPDDGSNKWETRPDNLYFKLYRKDKPEQAETANNSIEGFELVTKNYNDAWMLPASSDEQTDCTMDENGLITVPKVTDTDGQISYPLTIDNLPIGHNNNEATEQNNGEYKQYVYKFVECDSAGKVLTNADGETFAYRWSSGGDTALEFLANEGATDYSAASGENTVINRLKTENHTVKKKWKDDANNNIANYYNTRPDYFKVRLEKTTDQTPSPDGNWVTVTDNILLKSNTDSLDYHDQSADKDEVIPVDSLKNLPRADALKNLPQYDSENNKVYYRVVETALVYLTKDSSGQLQAEERPVNASYTMHVPDEPDVQYAATKTYYVSYNEKNIDNILTDKQTLIENSLIRKTDVQSFIAYKKWNDAENRLGERQPIKVSLVQTIKPTDGIETEVQRSTVTLDAANNWFYTWKNYPLRDEDGNDFNYKIVEQSELSAYNIQSSEPIFGGEKDTPTSYEQYTFTNVIQETALNNNQKALRAEKQWINEQDKSKRPSTISASCTYDTRSSIRPDAVRFDLYCTYDIYAYTSEPSFDADTGKIGSFAPVKIGTYDGLASESALTESRYLGSAYSYSRTIKNDAEHQALDTWAVTFELLPAEINLTGTDMDTYTYVYPDHSEIPENLRGKAVTFQYPQTENIPLQLRGTPIQLTGQAVDVKYYVKETVLKSNGDDPVTYSEESFNDRVNPYANTPAAAGNAVAPGNTDPFVIANTLKTRPITVTKDWEDNGYGDGLHYDIDFTLSCAAIGYTETRQLTATANPRTVTFENLPKYGKDGEILQYIVAESPHQYGYVQSIEPRTDTDGILTGYHITNTLPLTEVSVQKEWEDDDNTYGLRPGSITVALWRRPVTNNGAAWDPADAGWKRTDVVISADKEGKWKHTFAKLPKFDQHNIQYEYKAVESPVNAYDTYYDGNPDSPVVKTDNNQPTNSSLSFTIKNKLIKEKLNLVKIWNDNGCTQVQHYDVEFTIYHPNPATGERKINFSDKKETLTPQEKTNPVDGHETWKKPTDIELPVYYADGTPIQYTVTETNEQHYGYTASNGAATKEDNAAYYNTYTITNTLPVTNVRAQKEWEGDLEKYPQDKAEVNVTLTRSADGNADSDFSATEKIPYNGSAEFKSLLVKDFDGNDYTYTITEQTVKGYYLKNYVTTDNDNWHIFTFTNAPQKGSVELYKYDATDYEEYSDLNNFVLKTLPGAEFELHSVLNNVDKKIKVTGSDGRYTVTPNSTAETIQSGTDGIISISDLEPNDYYLLETKAPNGYQPNSGTQYWFKVDVDDVSNKIFIDYADSSHPINIRQNVLKNAVTDERVYGIPNEENLSKLTLTKVDMKDETIKLPNAHYDLLRLIDFRYKTTSEESETDYLTHALDVLNGGNFNPDSNSYWEKISSHTTDENGQITIEGDGHMFGTYVFYERKAPIGYVITNAYNPNTDAISANPNVLGPVKFDSKNATVHTATVYALKNLEPRKTAHINILKTDADGNPLKGAEFKLYQKDGQTPLTVYGNATDNSHYFAYSGNDMTVVTAAGYSSTSASAMKTDEHGNLYIENLEWGDYYLQETKAPAGYKRPDRDEAKTAFSVGRNNCDKPQELTVKNDPQTASLNIIKHIDELNEQAWGCPTFIFKLRQTAYFDAEANEFKPIAENKQPVLTKTITVQTPVSEGTGYENATNAFDIEPGTYIITEVRVARYEATAESPVITETSEGKVITSSTEPGTFSIKPDGSAEIRFENELTNYEKLSHTDSEINQFNTYKALRVNDKDGLSLDENGQLTIQKTALTPKLIKSDGTEEDVKDMSKLDIRYTDDEGEITVVNASDSFTVSGDREDVSGSIYKLTAEYDTFTTEFELRFASVPLVGKTEVTVIFQNDAENLSCFMDNGQQTNVYTLHVIRRDAEIDTILHHGTPTETAFPVLQIFAADKDFDKWSYTVNPSESGEYTEKDLLDTIKTAPDGAVITVTAELKAKSS